MRCSAAGRAGLPGAGHEPVYARWRLLRHGAAAKAGKAGCENVTRSCRAPNWRHAGKGPETRRGGSHLRVLRAVRWSRSASRFRGSLASSVPSRGDRVDEVTSRGKAMLVHFEEALSIYSDNQLYGRYVSGSAARSRGPAVSCAWPSTTRTGRPCSTAPPRSRSSKREHLEKIPFLASRSRRADRQLGPAQLVARLLDPRFRRRGRGLLLDQGLAGAGQLPARPRRSSSSPAWIGAVTAGRSRRTRSATVRARRWSSRVVPTGRAESRMTARRSARFRAAGVLRTDVRHDVFGRDGRRVGLRQAHSQNRGGGRRLDPRRARQPDGFGSERHDLGGERRVSELVVGARPVVRGACGGVAP